MPIDKRRLSKLAEARSTAIGRLLLRARLDFVNRSVRILHERGVPEFPASFLTLLPHLDTEGTRSTELARRAVGLRPGLPVLFMSGYTDDEIVRRGLLEAGQPFLQKPFTPEALGEHVAGLLKRCRSGLR